MEQRQCIRNHRQSESPHSLSTCQRPATDRTSLQATIGDEEERRRFPRSGRTATTDRTDPARQRATGPDARALRDLRDGRRRT